MTTTLSGQDLIPELMTELERLPPARSAALRIVQLVDDPRSTATSVAVAASSDPAFTAQLLRMANSTYYGLSGRVASASFAITVIGFETVRSLAAMAAAGAVGEGDLPPRFWDRATATASGTALVSRRVGANVEQAFCAGILHDLGSALLWRYDHDRYVDLLARADARNPVHVLEQREYGGTHASLCADVLAAWSFPDDLCAAIGQQHDRPSIGGAPLKRALQGGLALAGVADGRMRRHDSFVVGGLAAANVPLDDVSQMVARVQQEGRQLVGALQA